MPDIDNFQEKFIEKMKELSLKESEPKLYRIDGETESYIHNKLFQATNEYDLWLKLFNLDIIYEDEDVFDDINEVLDEWYLEIDLLKNGLKPLSELTEDEIIEWLIEFEIRTFRHGDEWCDDDGIFWIEMEII